MKQMSRERLQFSEDISWFILRNSSPTHSDTTVKHFLANYDMTINSHPPYSPNYAPPDSFIFPKVETTLKGVKFHDI